MDVYMKRSQVNAALVWAKKVLENNNFKLPCFGYWTMDEWKANREETGNIQKVMQGWDITDYGMGDFQKIGSVLFTIRNGKEDAGTPFAEKLIMLCEGQRLPCHHHVCKTEDIINRGGGILAIRLFNTLPDGGADTESDVRVRMDGILRVVKAGETIEITPGNSITLTPYLNHIFWAKPGAGDLLVGEVSSINDDNTDNYFSEPVSRFATIEEDEPILHPLCNEYTRVL